MRKYSKSRVLLVIVMCVIGLSVLSLPFYGLCVWTDRNLDYWLTAMKGAPVDVPMWLSVALAIVLNGVALLLNVVGELLRLVY